MSPKARLTFVGIGLVFLIAAVWYEVKPDHGYYVKAEFKDAAQLRKSSSVKIGGVVAGKVTNIVVTKRDTAIATLKINKEALPIGKDAKVNVRPSDLLGEHYADLAPGNIKDPMPKGGMIPIKNTVEPVELDDIFNTFDPDTRESFGVMLNELGTALDGKGKDLNTLLGILPLSLQQVRGLVRQVSDENVALKDTLTRGDRILATVNNKRDDLGGLIDEADGALNTVAQKRRELGSTIQNAPGALSQLRSTLTNLDAASIALRPTSKLIQQTTKPLKDTLTELPAFSKEADPTLKTARTVAPKLTKLGRGATPTIRRANQTAKVLNQALIPAKPALQHMQDRGTNDLLWFLSTMQRDLQGRDGVGHFIGAKFYADFSTVAQTINGFNGDKVVTRKKSDNAKTPDATPNLPNTDAPKNVQDTTKKVTDKVKDVTKKVTDTVHHVADNAQQTVDKTAGAVSTAVHGITDKVGQAAQQPQQGQKSGGGDATTLFNYLMGP